MSSKHKINYGAAEIELEDCPFCGSDKSCKEILDK